jgi:hypothetical protein
MPRRYFARLVAASGAMPISGSELWVDAPIGLAGRAPPDLTSYAVDGR